MSKINGTFSADHSYAGGYRELWWYHFHSNGEFQWEHFEGDMESYKTLNGQGTWAATETEITLTWISCESGCVLASKKVNPGDVITIPLTDGAPDWEVGKVQFLDEIKFTPGDSAGHP